LSTLDFTTPYYFFLKLCGIIAFFFFITVQCTWTPEVQTPIHTSEEGSVALKTSSNFQTPPRHPQVFSQPLIKQILQGISQSQDHGLLQEIFLSGPKSSPVFSNTQIEFLTPHLVDAFSKATSEELITFQYRGQEEEKVQVSGVVAAFPPTIFFLTLQNPEHSTIKGTSSGNLQKSTTLIFSQKDAMLQRKDVHSFMKTSPKEAWIAIDYAVLNTESQDTHKTKEKEPDSSITTSKPEETLPEVNSLEEQLQELRKKVDAQAEKIQQLQQENSR
jgi:hypothetical protein